ncbi:MAG: hypothetical protein MJ090_02395 [Clostridia bacterium]|nr:hypothetical protein [Clostridia bacterium]
MKKVIAILMALSIISLLCGCGGSESAKPSKKVKAVDSQGDSEIVEDVDDSDTDDSDIGGSNGASEGGSSNGGKDSLTADGEVAVGDAVYDLDFNANEIDSVEYKTYGSTLKTKWYAARVEGFNGVGKSDKAAETMRNKILSTKNTADLYKIKGTTYYISPKGNDDNDGKTPKTAFKTVDSDAFSSLVKPGDAVLFERGGVWRLTSSIKAREGVTYGSYGSGEKPAFYMSPYNYAREEFWLPSKRENIWKVSAADTDIGLVVFNEGEIVGRKQSSGIIALEKNGDYYYNKEQDTVYVYCDKGNPGKVFKDIEIGFRQSIISVTRAKNVTIDNLKLKYSGTFGISLSNSDNSKITNCEIGFIGGAYQNVTEMLRYGNGIQQWNSVYNQKVENNWIYQIYDAGLTWQGDYSWTVNNDEGRIDQYKDISYCNNLFEYCSFSIEFWHSSDSKTMITLAPVENFVCSNNISRFAGYGWGVQRTDHMGEHILCYNRAFKNAKKCKIQNNIFDLSYSYMVRWNFLSKRDNGDWDISGNTYYQKAAKANEGIWFGTARNATNQVSLQACVDTFDTNPKHVEWITG